jgi:hypothetical protein
MRTDQSDSPYFRLRRCPRQDNPEDKLNAPTVLHYRCLDFMVGGRSENARSRKIVARGAMSSSSYRSDWQRPCLQPEEEGNLVPALRMAAFISRVRDGFPQRRDRQPHIFQRGHIAFQGLRPASEMHF